MTVSPILVRVSELAVALAPARLTALGLGSCVAVALHDPEAMVGGMAHVLLPVPPASRPVANPGRYAATAVPALVSRMVSAGADPARLVARMAGGGAMFAGLSAPRSFPVGTRNVAAMHEALSAAGIPLAGEWVGGDFGRSMSLDVASGRVEVSSVRHGHRDL